jgi:hypothetical protein
MRLVLGRLCSVKVNGAVVLLWVIDQGRGPFIFFRPRSLSNSTPLLKDGPWIPGPVPCANGVMKHIALDNAYNNDPSDLHTREPWTIMASCDPI